MMPAKDEQLHMNDDLMLHMFDHWTNYQTIDHIEEQ